MNHEERSMQCELRTPGIYGRVEVEETPESGAHLEFKLKLWHNQ